MNLEQQFNSLDQLLSNNRQWWQFAAFHYLESRWKVIAPELDRQLEKQRLNFVSESNPAQEPSHLYHNIDLNQFIPDLPAIERLSRINQNFQEIKAPTSHWQYQIAGRKWSQITRFVPHVPKQKAILEWCSGKGHLGRLVASNGASSLVSLEWQQPLCDKNEALNQRLQIEQHYCSTQVHQCDVLSDSVSKYLLPQQFPIALHACGDLHTRLVQQVVNYKMQGLCIAPCCYNLIAKENYQPLSTRAQQSQLSLSKHDLSLPLKKMVTAGQREKADQSKEKLWRIAFDCWQREVLTTDQYMPLPTIPKGVLKSDFDSFVVWACKIKKHASLIQQAQNLDSSRTLAQANKRMPAILQMEWVQHHFQRAIEVWLLLDQALFLQENGYQCEIFEFCEVIDSPRNLMLRAKINH